MSLPSEIRHKINQIFIFLKLLVFLCHVGVSTTWVRFSLISAALEKVMKHLIVLGTWDGPSAFKTGLTFVVEFLIGWK